MNKQQIKDLALSNGFKLKQQPSGEMDLNPYVYEFASALIAKANERVKRYEKEAIEIAKAQEAFAIENQVKGAEALIYAFPLNSSDQMKKWVEQLRKEQE